MKKLLLILCFVISSLFSRSQLLQPEVVNSIQNYFFVPVMFDNLGNWVKGIENDSTIIFKLNGYYLEKDSIFLQFEMEKPGFLLQYPGAECKIIIRAHTITINSLLTDRTKSRLKFNQLGAGKITNLTLSSIITFDSTEKGKQMAEELQNNLDNSIQQYFVKKRVYVGNKKLKAPRHHNVKTRKCIHYYMNDEPMTIFTISNTVKDNKNQIALYLRYSLNN